MPARGQQMSEEHKAKIAKAHLGKKRPPFSEEHKRKIGDANRGSKSGLWRGGITPIWRAIRQCAKYRNWRKQVLERDKYSCVLCGVKDVLLNVDHKKPIAGFPELIYEVDNGRTLCVPCHKLTDSYGGKGRKYKKK